MKQLFHPSWRVSVIRYLFVGMGIVIIGRLFSLQVINHRRYETLAARQHYYKHEVIAERGKIFSADGTPLATTQDGYLLYITPPEVEDAEKLVDYLVTSLPYTFNTCDIVEDEMAKQEKEKEYQDDKEKCVLLKEEKEQKVDDEKKELLESIQVEGKLWVPVMRGLSVEQHDSIEAQKIAGIGFQSEKVRSYPEDTLAANILGFVGSDELGRPTGYFGLEGFYNGELTGTHGYVSAEVDAEGKPIPVGEFEPVDPIPGMNITLTIKRELQYILDKKLEEGVKKYQADFGTYILMDPTTGAIWAMGDSPTYQPGSWTDYLGDETDVAKVNVYQNHAISDNYEPGSVLKSLTMSAALDSSAVKESDTYNDTGPLHIQGYDIRTWNNQYHGVISMSQILQLSNNPGAASVGMKMGKDTLWHYFEKFGLGSRTSVDLQGEEAGLVKPPDSWTDIDVATASFGQGISVTPLQLISAVAAVANDGLRMKPYIVQTLYNPSNDETITFSPTQEEQVIKPETSQTMRRLLQSVVDEGEFQWFVDHAGLQNYPIAGKTGTAQIPVAGGYDPSKTNVTFVGFSPTDSPKFILLVRLNKTKTSTYSADTAVPLWLDMARELIPYFNIAPK